MLIWVVLMMGEKEDEAKGRRYEAMGDGGGSEEK